MVLTDREAGFRRILAGYRSRAKRLGIPFTLSTFDAKLLLSARCTLCGVGPQRYWNRAGASADSGYGDLFECNGIDRIDPKGPYSAENTRTACWTCNRAKSDMDDYSFFEWAVRLVDNLRTKGLAQ